MMKRQTYGQGPERSGACGTHTLCPCPPHEGLRLSGQISISGPSTSHLGMHSLSLLTFWSVTLVRVLLTQGGDCCGGGDFLLLVVCVLITKYLLHSLSGFFLPALPSTFFFHLEKKIDSSLPSSFLQSLPEATHPSCDFICARATLSNTSRLHYTTPPDCDPVPLMPAWEEDRTGWG